MGILTMLCKLDLGRSLPTPCFTKSIHIQEVLRPATREELSARPPRYLLDELARLEALERKSFIELEHYIKNLPMDVPLDVLDLLSKDAVTREAEVVEACRAGAAKGKCVRPSSCAHRGAPESHHPSPSVPACGKLENGKGIPEQILLGDQKNMGRMKRSWQSSEAPSESRSVRKRLSVKTASSAAAAGISNATSSTCNQTSGFVGCSARIVPDVHDLAGSSVAEALRAAPSEIGSSMIVAAATAVCVGALATVSTSWDKDAVDEPQAINFDAQGGGPKTVNGWRAMY